MNPNCRFLVKQVSNIQFKNKNNKMKIPEEVKISDNGFVFNSKTGDSFSLNPFGLELIKNIQEEKELEILKMEILEKYDVDDLTFEKDFYEFCALLKHHQIILQGNPMDFK
jgi:hypothetical protein